MYYDITEVSPWAEIFNNPSRQRRRFLCRFSILRNVKSTFRSNGNKLWLKSSTTEYCYLDCTHYRLVLSTWWSSQSYRVQSELSISMTPSLPAFKFNLIRSGVEVITMACAILTVFIPFDCKIKNFQFLIWNLNESCALSNCYLYYLSFAYKSNSRMPIQTKFVGPPHIFQYSLYCCHDGQHYKTFHNKF